MKNMNKTKRINSNNKPNTELDLNESKSFNKQLKVLTNEISSVNDVNNQSQNISSNIKFSKKKNRHENGRNSRKDRNNSNNIKNGVGSSINNVGVKSVESNQNQNSYDNKINKNSDRRLINNDNKRIRLNSNSHSNSNQKYVENQKFNREDSSKTSKSRFEEENKSGVQKSNSKNLNLRQLHESYELYSKSKSLYETYCLDFNLEKNKFKNSDFKWTLKLITEGTFEDKIGALSQHIKKNPKKTLNYLLEIIDLSKSTSIRHKLLCYQYLKDLFISSVLENKKYLEFTDYLRYYKQINNTNNTPDNVLIDAYIEDSIHKLYNMFLVNMEENLKQDSISVTKKQVLEYFFELLKSKPEKEEYLLDLLIYKLGDPKTEISNQSLILIKKLQESHVKMSLVILKRIKAFINDETLCDENGCYHALTLISQFKIFKNEDYLKFGLNMFFKLFNIYTEKDNVKYHKHLDAVIKTITTFYKSAIQLSKDGGDSENVRIYFSRLKDLMHFLKKK